MSKQNLDDQVQSTEERTVFEKFIEEETGAVMLEYVTLLIGCFLTIHATIMPLRVALIGFIRNIYSHLTLP